MLEVVVRLELQAGVSVWQIPKSSIGLSPIYATGVFGVDYFIYAVGQANYSEFDLVLCPPPDALGGFLVDVVGHVMDTDCVWQKLESTQDFIPLFIAYNTVSPRLTDYRTSRVRADSVFQVLIGFENPVIGVSQESFSYEGDTSVLDYGSGGITNLKIYRAGSVDVMPDMPEQVMGQGVNPSLIGDWVLMDSANDRLAGSRYFLLRFNVADYPDFSGDLSVSLQRNGVKPDDPHFYGEV